MNISGMLKPTNYDRPATLLRVSHVVANAFAVGEDATSAVATGVLFSPQAKGLGRPKDLGRVVDPGCEHLPLPFFLLLPRPAHPLVWLISTVRIYRNFRVDSQRFDKNAHTRW